MSQAASDSPSTGVRRTLFGLERRGLLATGIVATIVALFGLGLPLLASAVPSPGHTVEAGTVIVIPDGRARFTPASGWTRNRDDVPKSVVSLVSGSVEFRIASFASNTDASALVDNLKQNVRNQLPSVKFLDDQTLQTTSGVVGVGSWFNGPDQEGFVAAFSKGGSAVLVSCRGLTGAVTAQHNDVDAMVASIELIR